jgi:hypothetical protein
MTTPQDPRRQFARPRWAGLGQPDPPPASPDESTVLLPHPDTVATMRVAPTDPAATLHLAEPVTPGSREEHRFGPGVPALVDTTDDRIASIWHGTVHPGEQSGNVARRRPRRGRLLGGWLLPAVVLIAVLAYVAWQRYPTALTVTGATVRTDPGGAACHETAVITGTVKTNGREGNVRYRWKRSDGTTSSVLLTHLFGGERQTDVVMLWTFDGHGTMRATTTLEVVSPDPTTVSVTFTYACP